MDVESLLSPKRNCWKLAPAVRGRFLVDAAEYFQAFAEAAEGAQRHIIITAWDIDGRILLRPNRPRETLRAFFLRLLREKPDLHIYILNWEFVLLYAKDRELLPMFDGPWREHPRLHFEWDSFHPLGACHHQKVVVIDDTLAFVGGLDFTHERWDTPAHMPRDARRLTLSGKFYKPFHDTALMVEGPVAQHLGQLVRRRWRRCVKERKNGCPYPPLQIPSGKSLWPATVPVDFGPLPVAVARTEPTYGRHKRVCEIETLYLDMIACAQGFVYIENQYFTAERILSAIEKRLQEAHGPEFIVILPQGCTGWLEEASLGLQRAQLIPRLRKKDRYGHLHVYYPYIAGLTDDDYLKVHSKLMIVDDRFLQLGSANLCNRSMMVDTECNLAIEAPRQAFGGEPAIRQFRLRLLAEHVGTVPERVEEEYERRRSWAGAIQALGTRERHLVEFNGEVSALAQALGPGLTGLEFEKPLL